MADLTKTFNTGSSKGVSAQITVTSTMDVQTNTSLVSVAVALKSTSYLGQYYLDGTIKGDTNNTLATMSSSGGTHFITIGAKNTPYAIQGSGSSKGSPWSFTAAHDNDGSKTITVSVSIKGYNIAGSGGAHGFSISGSFSVVLPQIPRASTIGATDANIGSASMVAVSRKSTTYTHSVRYEFGELSGYLTADGSISTEEVKTDASSIAFNIPTAFYEQIPNAKSAPCTLVCRTYAGETQIGSDQSATFVITAAESLCSPQVSGTVEDINPLTLSLTGNKAKLVRYVSNALCTISATARNAATIATKSIDGQIVDGDTLTIEKMAASTVDFSATDSRGYTRTSSAIVELIPYIPLTCVASGRRTNPTDGNAVISVKGNYFNDTFGAVDNYLSVEYKIGDGDWVAVMATTSGNTYTATANVNDLDYTKSFAITVKATDEVGSVEQTFTIGKGIPVFDWGENDFRFNVPVSLNNGAYDANGNPIGAPDTSSIVDLVYPVGSIYMSVNGASPQTLFGGTWEQLKDRFLLAAGDTYAAGEEDGEAEHTLTLDEMPSHSHDIRLTSKATASGSNYVRVSSTGDMAQDLLSSTGGGEAHNNMPPYLAVYMWKRTA